MSARKLQAEIDRTFKRIAEGVAVFEGLYDKISSTTNPAQKDKLEQDLKKEIKKLQRHRDQIKTWAAGNEIKDKRPLLENRKLIEVQMERFKTCEKEMKTKAFSKEGLSAAAKLDPREREKMEVCAWLSSSVDELERQIEQYEAEIEGLNLQVKKGKQNAIKNERLEEVEHTIERHKWHQEKLELILRSLENDGISADQVKAIKDDVGYYIDSNQDVDFTEDDNIYDELNLIDEPLSDDDKDDDGDEDSDGPSLLSSALSVLPSDPDPAFAPAFTPTPAPTSTVSVKSPELPRVKVVSSAVPKAPPTIKSPMEVKANPLPPLVRVASAASHLSFTNPINTINPSTITSNTVASAKEDEEEEEEEGEKGEKEEKEEKVKKVPILQYASAAATGISSTVKKPMLEKLPPPREPAPISPPTPSPSSAALNSIEPIGAPSSNQDGRTRAESSAGSLQGSKPSAPPSVTSTHQEKTLAAPIIETPPVPSPLARPEEAEPAKDDSGSRLPPALADLMPTSFRFTEAEQTRMLEASLSFIPDANDADRPRHYVPKEPYPTPTYYPHTSLDLFTEPESMEKVDIDTLFYIFYYGQGTYQQYLASKELKKQAWRFHKRYLTWFQRHEEPKVITDEYESGTYRYFDFEGAWVQRKKSEFKFQYCYLEDEA